MNKRSSIFLLFIIICLLTSLSTYIESSLLVDDNLLMDYYLSFGQFSYERVFNFLETRSDLLWINHVIIPIRYFIKFLLIGVALNIGFLLINAQVESYDFLGAVIISELVSVLQFFVKISWFSFFQVTYSLQEIQFFAPLSLLNLFEFKLLDPLLIYPLQLLNLFELAYWCILAWQLKDILNRDFAGSLGFVAST